MAETGHKSSRRFSLYPLAICRFALAIKKPPAKTAAKIRKVKFPKDDEAIWVHVRDFLEELERRAKTGSKVSNEHLNFVHYWCLEQFQKNLATKARAGQHSWPPPIRTILEMADYAIPLLLWLAEHQRENIKKYASNRWNWPGYFHLLKSEQSRYQDLLPVFNQTGTREIQPSPIDLGKNLCLNLSANRTSGDCLFRIAARAIFDVAHLEEKEGFNFPKTWMLCYGEPFHRLNGGKLHHKIEAFLKSLENFSRKNRAAWQPVFEAYLTWFFAPPEIKFKALPKFYQDNLAAALDTGTENQWFENFRQRKKLSEKEEREFMDYLKKASRNITPLQNENYPEISAIGGKSLKAKWNALKREILKRIFKLAPKE